jgi:MYXO-CTERM domain-containing protein
LTGANNYTGTTTVAGGTLQVNSAAQTPILTGPGNAVINSGNLVLDYTGGSDPTSTVVGILAANIGSDNTAGQIRTGNAANANRGIGYRDDTAASQLLLRYTYRGDANLDGKVNAIDFNILASNFGAASKPWVQGDFNYDGAVNTTDFNYIATNFNAAALPSEALGTSPVGESLGTLVPEPSMLGLATLGAALGVRRRRRG